MYTLDNKPPKLGILKGILVVLGLLLALLVFMFIAWLFREVIPFWRWLSYAAALGLAIFIMYRYILGYRATINRDQLVIERISGTRARLLWSCRLSKAKYYGPVENAPPCDKVRRFVRGKSDLPTRAILTKQDDKPILVILQVDEKLDELLQAASSSSRASAHDDARDSHGHQ